MLSESSNYGGSQQSRKMREDNHKNRDLPTPYQNSSRTGSIVTRPGDHTNSGQPPSPASATSTPWKSKQYHSNLDPMLLVDNLDIDPQVYKRKPQSRFTDTAPRRNSTDQSQNEHMSRCLSSQREMVDSCSTETITSSTDHRVKQYSQGSSSCSVNSSISMPSFNLLDLPQDGRSVLRNGYMGKAPHRQDDYEFLGQIPQPYTPMNDEGNAITARNIPPMVFNEIKVKVGSSNLFCASILFRIFLSYSMNKMVWHHQLFSEDNANLSNSFWPYSS